MPVTQTLALVVVISQPPLVKLDIWPVSPEGSESKRGSVKQDTRETLATDLIWHQVVPSERRQDKTRNSWTQHARMKFGIDF